MICIILGWMFQHRGSRAFFAKQAAGKSVLDLFCHTGSFARLAAALSNSAGTAVTGTGSVSVFFFLICSLNFSPFLFSPLFLFSLIVLFLFPPDFFLSLLLPSYLVSLWCLLFCALLLGFVICILCLLYVGSLCVFLVVLVLLTLSASGLPIARQPLYFLCYSLFPAPFPFFAAVFPPIFFSLLSLFLSLAADSHGPCQDSPALQESC